MPSPSSTPSYLGPAPLGVGTAPLAGVRQVSQVPGSGVSPLGFGVGFSAAVRGASIFSSATDDATALATRAKLQSDLLARSQAVANGQAADAELQGRFQANKLKERATGYLASRRALLASQGLDPDAGSGLDEQVDVEGRTALEAMTVQNNAALQAYGYSSYASDQGYQAKMSEIEGKYAAKRSMLNGGLAAADEFFGGVDKYFSYKTALTSF